MINNIRVGVEIECICNINKKDVFNFPIGSYRNGERIPNLNWLAETDSSIHISRTSRNKLFSKFIEEPLELISPTVRGKKEFFNEMNKFIKYFSRNGKYKLKDIFYFNKTCGSHIHISIFRKPMLFSKLVINKLLIKTRNKFLEEIKNSSFSKKIKTQIIKNYNRSFASTEWEGYKRDQVMYRRNYEFNFYSEVSGKGIEWRSINMYGIETWEHFREFWKIVYNCIESLVTSSKKWKQQESYNMNINQHKKYFKTNKQTIEIDDREETSDGLFRRRFGEELLEIDRATATRLNSEWETL